ncbi:MAG: HEPN domain-containing protein [Candidatus Helarchaeota archaeon]|nr:HEPN domain-containing protein [Candidatus Helarchaeota archaeon]
MFDDDEYVRWMREAENTLKSAITDKENEFYNWCCFKCQQAAEFGLKAFLYGIGSTPFGHSLIKLADTLESQDIDVSSILTICRRLDLFYIPSRYPNAHSTGSPYEYYDDDIAQEALENAQKILNFVKGLKNDRLPKENK